MAGSKGRGELVNCSECGRDTRAQGGICARCLGGENRFASDEGKGRKSRSTKTLGGTSIPDTEPEEGIGNPSASEAYHGKTIRDDL